MSKGQSEVSEGLYEAQSEVSEGLYEAQSEISEGQSDALEASLRPLTAYRGTETEL